MKHPHFLLVLLAPALALSSLAYGKGAWDFEGTRNTAIQLVLQGAEASARADKCDTEYLVPLVVTNLKMDTTFIKGLRDESKKVLSDAGQTCLEGVISSAEKQSK